MTNMDDEHTYPPPDEDEGFLYVREWEDHRLEREYDFLKSLFEVVASEIAFRADNPEQRDDTGDIRAKDVRLYELADKVRASYRPVRVKNRD